ncbi:Muskelin N-terminus-domain-containing protein [Coemansia spiralis]|nr:Muskelin N-terminus-domain-containing protein [Coemansia spiralis]
MTAHSGNNIQQTGMSNSTNNSINSSHRSNTNDSNADECEDNGSRQLDFHAQESASPFPADRHNPEEGHSSSEHSASFLINSNYRIIAPSPDPITNSRNGQNGTIQNGAAAAAAGLPSWISPTSQSKTYFPARSPIINANRDIEDHITLADANHSGNSSGHTDDEMQLDGGAGANNIMQELRTEYDALPYEIHTWSSHSANFMPHNILCDRPHDQASRWSTNANNHRQFITLRLEHPALVRSIKFGKYYKTHVCNLKEFKVYGGMTEDNMIELLYSGLRNDSEAETISLKQKLNGFYIPCQYIKIQPLLAHDQKFNFSIWHVELRGTMNPHIVQRILSDFNRFKEREVVRSCLKFFRDRNYIHAFDALAQQSSVCLEAPILTGIQKALVEEGNYDLVEHLLHQAEGEGVFSSCTDGIPYAAAWDQLDSIPHVAPSARGGHQMCIDEEARIAYMYGGWDGANNLGDLWMLHMDTGKWVCISTNTRDQGGPGPRSCHVMCFDSVHKCLYVMGKYIDHEYRGNTGLENDLYCYDTLNNEWLVLSENTEVMNGPKLLFNTQMVFDPIYHCIYVYGGKVVLPDANDSTIVYSGLYRFDLRQHRWTKLKPDFHMMEQEQHVRGRYFHSMIIDPQPQRIYILSGKRDVTTPCDLVIYDIATNIFFEKMTNLAAANPTKSPMTQRRYLAEQQRVSPMYSVVQAQAPLPPSDSSDHHPHHVHLVHDGRTIRATLDSERQEIYVLASAQSDANPLASAPMLQSLMSLRAAREPGLGYIDQSTASTLYSSGYRGASSQHAIGAGFHPCSTFTNSSAGSDSTRFRFTGSSAGFGTDGSDQGISTQRKGVCVETGGARGSQRWSPQLSADNILMVVLCYHIPSETWTEVYNSAHAAAVYNATVMEAAHGINSERLQTTFPPPRFAQDWVFDRKERRHYMFGGNPNRPNDKSARFNDTWRLRFTRPNSQDILRRALYLVRQRRFLDMCFGIEATDSLSNQHRNAGDNTNIDSNLSASGKSIAGLHPNTENIVGSIEDYKASAIPSPNSNTLLDSQPETSSPAVKRSSPLAADGGGDTFGRQNQRQKMAESSSTPKATSKSKSSASDIAFPHDQSKASSTTSQALAYLQQQVAPLIDHNDVSECQSFHALSTALFQIVSTPNSIGATNQQNRSSTSAYPQESLRRARSAVYEALLAFFPENQQQPFISLDDLITRVLD